MSVEIYTYGYGDLMQTALNAIAAIVSSSNFKGMLATAIALYLARVFWNTAHGRYVDFGRILKNITLIIALALSLTQIKDTVIVTDKTTPSLSGIVDNVPVAVYLPLWFSNRAEYVITRTFETAFSLPDGVSYNSVGYAGGVKNLRDAAYYIRIEDAYLKESLVQFYKDCVFAALIEGLISPDQVKRDTVKNVITAAASAEPSRTTVYYSSSYPDGVSKTCEEAAGLIKTDLDKDRDKAFADLAKVMGYGTNTAALESVLGSELQYFMGISSNAKDAVYQEALLTVSHDALIRKAGEAGLDPNQLGLTVATTKEKLFLTNASMGDTIRAFLPYIRAFLNILFVAVTPVLIVIGIGMGRPLQYIGTAVMLAAFPLFWGMIGSVINWIIASQVNDLAQVIETTKYSTATINIENYPVVVSALKEWLTIGGWASSLIIILSLALLTGSTYAFVRFAGGFASGIAGAASSSAAGAATGNLSYGNVSVGNTSANNFSANKFDDTSIFRTGQQISQHNDITRTHDRIFSDRDSTIYDHSTIFRNGANASIDGQSIFGTKSYSYGGGTNYSDLQQAGKDNIYNHQKSNGTDTSKQETYSLQDKGSSAVSGNEAYRLSQNANFNLNGTENLLGGNQKSYTYGLNRNSTILDGQGFGDSQRASDKTLATADGGLGWKGGPGSGGAGGSSGRFPSKGGNPYLQALKKLSPDINLNLGIRGINDRTYENHVSHDGKLNNQIGDSENTAIVDLFAKKYGFNVSGGIGETGNHDISGSINFNNEKAYLANTSTAKVHRGHEGDSISSTARVGSGASINRHYDERENSTFQKALIPGLIERAKHDQFLSNRLNQLMNTARTYISEDARRFIDTLEDSGQGDRAKAILLGVAATKSPEIANELVYLAQQNYRDVKEHVEEKMNLVADEVKTKGEQIDPNHFDPQLKEKVVKSLYDTSRNAQQLKEEAQKGVAKVHGKAAAQVESSRGKALAKEGTVDQAHNALTRRYSTEVKKFHKEFNKHEEKANETPSTLRALHNAAQTKEFKMAAGAMAVQKAYEAYRTLAEAKAAKDVTERLAKRTHIADVHDLFNIGKKQAAKEAIKDTVVDMAKGFGKWLARGATAAGGAYLGALIDAEPAGEQVVPVNSMNDLKNLQPGQVGRIGNYYISPLPNGNFLVSSENDQGKELSLAETAQLVLMDKDKLEKTGSTKLVLSPQAAERLKAKLIE
jgi:hypothetical protein